MIKNKPFPFKSDFNFLFKVYSFLIITYTAYAYLYGYLASSGFRETLKIHNLSLPVDDVKTQINGGLNILTDFFPIVYCAIVFPTLFIIIKLGLHFFKIKIQKRKWHDIPIQFGLQIAVYFIIFIPLLIIPIITKPIDRGIEDAEKLINDPKLDQLVLKKHYKDSVINCKVVYFTKNYAVFIKDSITHAVIVPNGSYVTRELNIDND